MRVRCAKGCGHYIEVPDDLLREHGQGTIQHTVCPGNEPEPLRTYKIKIEIYRHEPDDTWELLASVGGTAEAENLLEAVPKIETVVQDKWQIVSSMALMAESDEEQESADGDSAAARGQGQVREAVEAAGQATE